MSLERMHRPLCHLSAGLCNKRTGIEGKIVKRKEGKGKKSKKAEGARCEYAEIYCISRTFVTTI